MAIERAHARAVQKPWGSRDLEPWAAARSDGAAIGELWYERTGADEQRCELLLKLLITTQELSIQVHPDDAYAKSVGLRCGKTEAWYILAAAAGAKVAVGLKERITPSRLRQAIDDGSIVDLVQWRAVAKGDVVHVPAGTIHAIGPGITIAEIQQRSNSTFRMFDFGRGRELHVADAIAVANAGPAECPSSPVQFTRARSLLVVDPHFVLERIDLLPGTTWDFHAERETWVFVLRGSAQIGPFDLSVADAILIEDEHVRLDVSSRGLRFLAAYPGPDPVPDLLRVLDSPAAGSEISRHPRALHLSSLTTEPALARQKVQP